MTKSRQDVEDVVFNLNRAHLLLANRQIPENAVEPWLEALKPYHAAEILVAIDAHIAGDSDNDSKYAPRPKHLIDLIKRSRARGKGFKREYDDQAECDPDVQTAWMICLRKGLDFDASALAEPAAVEMTEEEALTIVNRQAKFYRDKLSPGLHNDLDNFIKALKPAQQETTA